MGTRVGYRAALERSKVDLQLGLSPIRSINTHTMMAYDEEVRHLSVCKYLLSHGNDQCKC